MWKIDRVSGYGPSMETVGCTCRFSEKLFFGLFWIRGVTDDAPTCPFKLFLVGLKRLGIGSLFFPYFFIQLLPYIGNVLVPITWSNES